MHGTGEAEYSIMREDYMSNTIKIKKCMAVVFAVLLFIAGALSGLGREHLSAHAAMEPFEITQDMRIGWNLGNSLDAFANGVTGLSTETSWGNPKATKAMIDAVKAKGFNTVRVPVTWFPHLDGNNNIDSAWMARVKEVVDYAIDNDMYVILNIHHEEWINRADLGTAYDSMKPRFIKIWTQIAETFKNYDQHLIFEAMNEPRAAGTNHEWWGAQQSEMDTINKLNADFVKLIRSIDSPYKDSRLLMVPGYCASSDPTMISMLKVPNDKYVAVSVHCYLPFNFAMGDGNHSVFTSDDAKSLDQTFSDLRSRFISKGIPVIIGECGASNFNNTDARVKWAEKFFSTAKQTGIPCILWDNNVGVSGNSECFGWLDRSSCKWYSASEPVVNKMIEAVGASSTDYIPPATTTANGSSVTTTTEAEESTAKIYPITLSANDRSGKLIVSFNGTPSCNSNGCVGFMHNGEWEMIKWEGMADGSGALTVEIPMSEIPAGITDAQVQIWWSNGEIEFVDFKAEQGATSTSAATTSTTITSTTTTTTTTTSTTTTTADSKTILCGDANCDGYVNISDAVAILQHIGNPDKYPFNEKASLNADCFEPGSGITGSDALAIQKLDAGVISSLPEKAA